jgi:hypothetical protein
MSFVGLTEWEIQCSSCTNGEIIMVDFLSSLNMEMEGDVVS